MSTTCVGSILFSIEVQEDNIIINSRKKRVFLTTRPLIGIYKRAKAYRRRYTWKMIRFTNSLGLLTVNSNY